MKSKLTAALLILATALLAGCAYDPLIVNKDYIPRRIVANISHLESGVYGPKSSRIVFRNRSEIRSGLVDIDFFGQLAAKDKPPFNIYSARRCYNCESNRSIYIHSAASGRLSRGTRRFRYPGRLFSHINGSLVEESRAFYGDCLPGYGASVVVWYVRSRQDRPDWEELVEVAEASSGSLTVQELSNPAPPIKTTLGLVKDKRCREIPTLQMSTEP